MELKKVIAVRTAKQFTETVTKPLRFSVTNTKIRYFKRGLESGTC